METRLATVRICPHAHAKSNVTDDDQFNNNNKNVFRFASIFFCAFDFVTRSSNEKSSHFFFASFLCCDREQDINLRESMARFDVHTKQFISFRKLRRDEEKFHLANVKRAKNFRFFQFCFFCFVASTSERERRD